ncbi:MAG: tRNA dihydrouridine synthase DusB [Bowdeniella nasicola]|nr:tRNA dihydrouridine synthase DusB [Bowdeniella nasicola]
MSAHTLHLGPIEVGTPVVLAPMAGVTTPPFRRLCREAGLAGLAEDATSAGACAQGASAQRPLSAPAGLYVTEMVTSRALVERHPATMLMVRPDPTEMVRSVQLYGVDPATIAEAVRILLAENLADHIDLNFGCPVPKVTRRGGGAALPWKADLFREICRRAVATAEREASAGICAPVTVKMRLGIDEEHLTYLDAARAARDVGVAAVALHARTAAQHYSGHAHWDRIARLKEDLGEYPVLGNGDIFSGDDALAMLERTGCDGVVVGRGCQGRPWLFTDIVAALHGSPERVRPTLREVGAIVYRHAELMVAHFGDESKALREMRKHMAWYFKGYPVGGSLRHRLALVQSLVELRARLDELDPDAGYPGAPVEGRRGRAGSERTPHLPHGWLDSRELSAEHRAALESAELGISGG